LLKRKCFANDFDAQAHCIKINVKAGAFTPALIHNYIKVLAKAGLSRKARKKTRAGVSQLSFFDVI